MDDIVVKILFCVENQLKEVLKVQNKFLVENVEVLNDLIEESSLWKIHELKKSQNPGKNEVYISNFLEALENQKLIPQSQLEEDSELYIDLTFLENQATELSFENLVEDNQLKVLKKKIHLQPEHHLRNGDFNDFFKFYKISYSNYSFLHHSYIKCTMQYYTEIPQRTKTNPETGEVLVLSEFKRIKVGEKVIAFIDIFGYLVIVEEKCLAKSDDYEEVFRKNLRLLMDLKQIQFTFFSTMIRLEYTTYDEWENPQARHRELLLEGEVQEKDLETFKRFYQNLELVQKTKANTYKM